LWVRPLHGLTTTPLSGAEAAIGPFWSADGRSVGFFSPGEGAVKRIDLAGGPAVVVGPGFPGRGTWNRDGIILRGGAGIHQLAVAGGAPVRVTTLDESRGETRHVDPRFLPDGRHFLFLAIGRRDGGVVNADAANGVYVGTLGSNEQKLLLPDAGSAAYGSGHLLFMRGRTLMAQPFDVERLELGGEARPLVDGVSLAGSGPGAAMASFSVSATGVLVYRHGSSSPLSRLVWFDRSGRQEDALGEPANYSDLALSPEGRRVAVAIAQEGGAADLFVHDLGGTRTRLTTDEGDQSQPVWSPDGKRILFRTNYNTGAGGDFRVKDATGGAEEVLQKNPATTTRPLAWSPDGRFILFTQGAGGGGGRRDDLWLLPVARPGDARGAEAAPVRFAETPLRENEARFSPDGRWIAYDAGRDAGRRDVYVASFPAAAGPVQVSTAGGMAPTWRGDGGEIYYVSPDRKMMAAEVNGRGAAFQVGTPRVLFDVPRMVNVFEYAVTADGKRFLVNQREDSELPGVGLVVNWPSLLK
jgi:hypothetical protein